MATKTISITEDAYSILKSWKIGKESFSDVILKVGRKNRLADFAGILSEDEGNYLVKSIKNSRTASRNRYKRKVLN